MTRVLYLDLCQLPWHRTSICVGSPSSSEMTCLGLPGGQNLVPKFSDQSWQMDVHPTESRLGSHNSHRIP